MKKFTAILSLVLSAALLFALCACGSTWGKVKSAYEKEGYSELKISEKLRAAIEEKTDEKLEDSDATLHFMTKAKINDDDSDAEVLVKAFLSPFAIVWEYKNVEAVQKAYKEDLNEEQQKDFDKLWEEYQKSDSVNGNCVLILGDKEIFKSSK